jgi:hypothetical protein
MAHDQRDYGVACESCRPVSVGRSSSSKEDGGGLFASAIRLAFHVDDSDDGTLDGVFVFIDYFTDAGGQRVCLFQAYFAMPSARETPRRVRNNT